MIERQRISWHMEPVQLFNYEYTQQSKTGMDRCLPRKGKAR